MTPSTDAPAKTAEQADDLFAKAHQPKWFKDDLMGRYFTGIAHAFIMHGPGVADYATQHNMSLRTALEKGLRKWACVVFYDRARGLTFSRESVDSEKEFKSRLKVAETPTLPGQTNDPEAWMRRFAEPANAVAALDTLLRMHDDRDRLCAFVLDMAEFVVPDANLAAMGQGERQVLATIERWGRDPLIQASGNIIILVAGSNQDIHSRLRAASAKFENVEVPIPNRVERLAYVREMRTRNAENIYEDGMTNERVADHTAGLTRIHIEDVYLKAKEQGKLTLSLIKERKEDIIRSEYGDVVQILEPRGGFETMGGYEHLREPFTKRIINPLREGKPADWGGVILVGPPGTGKTHFAEVIAKEAGVNALELRISKLLSKWVGESDKNLAKALGLIDSMVPCVAFIDELDVALPNRAGGDNDSGVSNRILAALMPFMADPKRHGRVVWIGATNRIDKVDAALKRVGRFDRVVPILAPTEEDRIAVLEVIMAGQSCPIPECALEYPHKVKAATLKLAATKTPNWTPANLKDIASKAHEFVKDDGASWDDALTQSLEVVRLSASAAITVEYQSLVALVDCNDISLLPKKVVADFKSADTQKRLEELQNMPQMRQARRDN